MAAWHIKYVPKYDNYGKLIIITVEEIALKEIFSTKFMRKTAATIDNMLGIPAKTSMKRTGHKTFAAYSRYVDVNKDSMAQANKHWDELAEKQLNEPEENYQLASYNHFGAMDFFCYALPVPGSRQTFFLQKCEG